MELCALVAHNCQSIDVNITFIPILSRPDKKPYVFDVNIVARHE